MRDELAVPFKKSEEDALCGWRRFYGWRAGTLARLKRGYRERCRQSDKRRIETMVDKTPTLPK